jgi:pectate lyase
MRTFTASLVLLVVACGSGSDGDVTSPGSAGTGGSSVGAGASASTAGGATGSGGGSTASSGGGGAAAPDAIEGYGAISVGGTGGDVCTVTTLADSGPGSLRACVMKRTGPRIVEFAIGGTITLASDLLIQAPFLTIDGATAPAPGITIEKVNAFDGEVTIAGTHDVIVRHLRFWGTYQPGDPVPNNTGTIGIDGDANPDHVVARIVLDHLTVRNATDSGPDIWGQAEDITIQWGFFFESWHPSTISHYPAPYQVRRRISLHHNVYARNNERNPQIRADVRDLDYVNNVVYAWGNFEPVSGYGVRIRNDPGEPLVNANLIANYFLPTSRPQAALIYGADPGADGDDGGPNGAPPQGTVVTTTNLGDLWVAENVLPPENLDQYSTIASPLPVPPAAQVTTYDATELKTVMLPDVGMLHRDAAEQAILDDLAAGM